MGQPAAGRTTAYRLACGVFDAIGEEEDGRIPERIDALLARSDGRRCRPGKSWAWPGGAKEPAAVKGAFRELSRLLHPDKNPSPPISGEKLLGRRPFPRRARANGLGSESRASFEAWGCEMD